MKLINHVLDIRRLIQQSFDNRFSRLGLKPDTPVSAALLSEESQKRRIKLENIMQNHLDEFQSDYAAARQATINECVFTLFNRIAAIKVMESKELFPEIITRRKENSGRSFEHNAWLEDHPEERNAEREGLKHFLTDQFNQIGENIPLFKADYPYSLMPTADELNEIIDQFNAIEADPDCGEDVWKGDDILGWLYENFNSVEKEVFDDSGEKTEYDKVSLQSQVYTPQWVVKFLVDNTLGKSYLEMYPDSKIKEKYKIANAPDKQKVSPKCITEMKLLDPACGSGNFLIYAFTLFYDLYIDQMENYGKEYSRRDIPKMIIENNLYGVDLDERAAQISQIALFIKAREVGGHRSHWPKYTNIVSSHFFLPSYDTVRAEFGYDTSWNQKYDTVARKIWTDLSDAYKFGSLVRVEEQINALKSSEDNPLYGSETSFYDGRVQLKTQLSNLVNKYGEKSNNAYSLLKMNEAMSFLDIISNPYDIVVANPPYTDSGDFGQELKAFVDDNYKKPYKCNGNLYACFIKRCCELTDCNGYVGIVNPPTFMYIKKYEDLRKFILEKTHISLFVEWGYLGMFASFARVDSAVFILDMKDKNEKSIFIKLNDLYEMKRKDVLFKVYDDLCNGLPNNRVYTITQSKLKGIKSYPFIYWISDDFRKKFNNEDLGKNNPPVIGIMTGDNNRFLRYHWEIDKKHISKEYNSDKLQWIPYHKGGPFQKWYGNKWLLVNFKNEGEHLSSIPNKKYWFKGGVTFGRQSTKGASYRIVEKNDFFDNGAPCIIANGNPSDLLGYLNSRLSRYVLWCLNPTVNKQAGDISRIPYFTKETNIHIYANQNIEIKKYLCNFSIIEPLYKESPISHKIDTLSGITSYYNKENAYLSLLLLNESIIDKIILEIYELSEKDKQMVVDKEGIPVGNLAVTRNAKIAFRNWLTQECVFKPTDDVLSHLDALEEINDLPQITDFDSLYQNNNEWENFCIRHNMNPVEVWWQFKNANILPSQRTQSLAFELITDVIRTILTKDDDGVIPLNDKLGEERLSLRIEREMMERGYGANQFNQICQLLGCTLERYLLERYFQQLSDYLNLFPNLPKTPFIWHLSSGPNHAMELYIIIYRWSRDTLFRIRSVYAANRETSIRDQLNSLDTTTTDGRMKAKDLQDMLAELQKYCEKIDDLLASGYNPTLDDGVGKNIAPLQKRGMISYDVLTDNQLKKFLKANW